MSHIFVSCCQTLSSPKLSSLHRHRNCHHHPDSRVEAERLTTSVCVKRTECSEWDWCCHCLVKVIKSQAATRQDKQGKYILKYLSLEPLFIHPSRQKHAFIHFPVTGSFCKKNESCCCRRISSESVSRLFFFFGWIPLLFSLFYPETRSLSTEWIDYSLMLFWFASWDKKDAKST